MIDEVLTKKNLGVTPYAGEDSRVKNRYRTQDYVVIRCDVCGNVYGKQHGIKLCFILQKRKRDQGMDLCSDCWKTHNNPLRVFENAREKFLQIVADNEGVVPPRNDLPWNLVAAINTYFDGYGIFREKCGLPKMQKPRGWWKKWENLERELRPLCEDLGFFPPDQYLLAVKASMARSALRHFGGAQKVAERLGYKLRSGYEADDGHFVFSYYEFAVDNVLFYHGVPHQTHPSIRARDKRRGDFKVGETFIEVAGFSRDKKRTHARAYHRKLEAKLALYADLNIPVIVIYKADFDNTDVVLRKLRPLIERYGRDGKKVDITNAIRPVSWWSDWANVRPLLEEVIRTIGHFPTAIELADVGKSSITHYVIKFHGGFSEARRKMGHEVRQESHGYFAKWGNVEAMFRPVCEFLGYFPSAQEIRDCKYGLIDCCSSLYKYWGSLSAVAKKLGFPTKRQFNQAERRKHGWQPSRKPESDLPSRQISRVCGHCGEVFRGRNKRQYCSRECYHAWRWGGQREDLEAKLD